MVKVLKSYPSDLSLCERVRFPRSFVDAFRIGWRIVRVVEISDGRYRCEFAYFRSPFRTFPRYHTIPVQGYRCAICVTRRYFYRVLSPDTINVIFSNGLFVSYKKP